MGGIRIRLLEYENFVVYTVYISTHLLCSVLQLIYVSDIYNMHIEGDVCDSDSELCCSEFLREIIALLQDTMCCRKCVARIHCVLRIVH